MTQYRLAKRLILILLSLLFMIAMIPSAVLADEEVSYLDSEGIKHVLPDGSYTYP